MRGSNCQNARRLTNMLFQPSPVLLTPSSVSNPTELSSVAIKPMRSSFGMRCLLLKIPSRLMFILHSPFGFPASGVLAEAAVESCGSGSGWWKYHQSVAHNIIAICRVGLVGGRNSWLLGLLILLMKRWSFFRVGCLKRWMCCSFFAEGTGKEYSPSGWWSGSSLECAAAEVRGSLSSGSSSECRMMVQPGGKTLWWVLSSLDLK